MASMFKHVDSPARGGGLSWDGQEMYVVVEEEPFEVRLVAVR